MPAPLIPTLLRAWSVLTRTLDHAQPLAALLARAYVAEGFFLSGLTKIRDWNPTLIASSRMDRRIQIATRQSRPAAARQAIAQPRRVDALRSAFAMACSRRFVHAR